VRRAAGVFFIDLRMMKALGEGARAQSLDRADAVGTARLLQRFDAKGRGRSLMYRCRLRRAASDPAHQQQHNRNEQGGEDGPAVENIDIRHDGGLPIDNMAD